MKPQISVRRTVHLYNYGYHIRESGDFPEGTEIAYFDDIDTKDTTVISIANLDDLGALIECLQARREEVRKYKEGLKF